MKESLTKKKLWYHFIKTRNYISHLYSNFWAVTVYESLLADLALSKRLGLATEQKSIFLFLFMYFCFRYCMKLNET